MKLEGPVQRLQTPLLLVLPDFADVSHIILDLSALYCNKCTLQNICKFLPYFCRFVHIHPRKNAHRSSAFGQAT